MQAASACLHIVVLLVKIQCIGLSILGKDTMYTIRFRTESGDESKIAAKPGDNILELAQALGVPIDAPCGGAGTCGKCRGRLISGVAEHTKSIKLSDEDFEDGWRLLCHSEVMGDAVFWIPASAASFQRGINTADFSSPEKLKQYDETLHRIFGEGGIATGRNGTKYGIAIDIGTTTVAGALIDIDSCKVLSQASMGNGQIRYGADVINRIISQGREGGIEKLRHAVREETIIPIVEKISEQSEVPLDAIDCVVIAGNTTMEHLFVGADGSSIRLEPFVPEFLELHDQTAGGLGLPFRPDVPVILAPNVGSYVGGDITAGVLSSMLWNSEEMTLFLDLGTNGELVYGNSDYMLCCACSAGPAFEGGDISCGMRASKGAICSCTIDPETYEPSYHTIDDEKPVGICGSGIIDIVAELFVTGIVNGKGKFSVECDRVIYDDTSARYVLATEEESGNGAEVSIDETDLDNFIRAKGAIFSAIETMLKSLDMPVEAVDRIIIAGGIGSGINIPNAIKIGMIPNIPVEKYSYIGNSSLSGACAMLVSKEAEQKVFDIGHNMTYIELSTQPGYMDEFVAACFLPHTDASLFA